MNNVLEKKTVLITGVTGGIGYEICKKYYEKNSKLVLVGRNNDSLSKIAKEFNAEYFCCDFSNLDEVEKIAIEISENIQIDILINSAGIFDVVSIEETSIVDIKETFNINFFAPFIFIKQFINSMETRNWGRIINIVSSSAYGAAANTSSYSSSKHALLGLSRGLFNEFKTRGVRVISVSPGSVKTKMGRKVEKLGQIYETFIKPSEVAEYVVYVSSLDDNLIIEEARLNRIEIQ
jgi:3-oxoacyl-[acyl-carrier protein] reductase